MLVLCLTIFLVFALVRFIYKTVLKRRLIRALGRSVKDHDLTSLNSWMEASKNKERRKN